MLQSRAISHELDAALVREVRPLFKNARISGGGAQLATIAARHDVVGSLASAASVTGAASHLASLTSVTSVASHLASLASVSSAASHLASLTSVTGAASHLASLTSGTCVADSLPSSTLGAHSSISVAAWFVAHEAKLSVSLEEVRQKLRLSQQKHFWKLFDENKKSNFVFGLSTGKSTTISDLLLERPPFEGRPGLSYQTFELSSSKLDALWDQAVEMLDGELASYAQIASVLQTIFDKAIFECAYVCTRTRRCALDWIEAPATHEWVLGFMIHTGSSPPRLSKALNFVSTSWQENSYASLWRCSYGRHLFRAPRARCAQPDRKQGGATVGYHCCRVKLGRNALCRSRTAGKSTTFEASKILHPRAWKMVDRVSVEGPRCMGRQA
jgi:hypothetical protein